jgi:hypothetical protein
MQAMASPAGRQQLPNSLMERLALQASGRLPVAVDSAREARQASGRLTVVLSFGLGAMASCVLGGLAFLGLEAMAAGDSRGNGPTLVSTTPQAPAVASWYQRQVFDVAIPRRERAHAPLRLHVTGDNADGIEIILHGVPAAARLSQGERRGAVTWVLKRADLDDLHLHLSDAAPDAFDVRIDVLAPPGVQTVGSVARVRVVDSAPQETGTAAMDGSPAHPAQQRWSPGTQATVAARQVWWTMPAQSWSPFQAGTP